MKETEREGKKRRKKRQNILVVRSSGVCVNKCVCVIFVAAGEIEKYQTGYKVGRKLYHKCLNIMCYMKSVFLINWQHFSFRFDAKIKTEAHFVLPQLSFQISLHTLQRSREHFTLLVVAPHSCDTNTRTNTRTDR